MTTNLLFAVIIGFGVFLIVISPKITVNEKRSTIDRISKLTEEKPQIYTGGSFLKSVRRNGLKLALTQADLDVTPSGFIRTGSLLVAGVVAAGYVISGSFLVSIFMGVGGAFMYLNWLYQRRDMRSLDYEEQLADMSERLAAGALLKGTLNGALTHASELAPEAVADDFEQATRAIVQGASIQEAFDDIRERRKSYALDLLIDSLISWSVQGTNISLSDVLDPMTETIRHLASERKRMESEMTGVRRQLLIVAVSPLVFVAFMRTIIDFRLFFSSPTGILLQIVSFAISAFTYWLGEKQLGAVRRVLDV